MFCLKHCDTLHNFELPWKKPDCCYLIQEQEMRIVYKRICILYVETDLRRHLVHIHIQSLLKRLFFGHREYGLQRRKYMNWTNWFPMVKVDRFWLPKWAQCLLQCILVILTRYLVNVRTTSERKMCLITWLNVRYDFHRLCTVISTLCSWGLCVPFVFLKYNDSKFKTEFK